MYTDTTCRSMLWYISKLYHVRLLLYGQMSLLSKRYSKIVKMEKQLIPSDHLPLPVGCGVTCKLFLYITGINLGYLRRCRHEMAIAFDMLA